MYDFLDKIGLKAVLEAIKGKMSEYASKALYGDTTINVGRKAGSDVGEYSTAIGHNTTASGYNSYSQGAGTTASGNTSHAEGSSTTASAYTAHAEGLSTESTANASHAEGLSTKANGDWSHAEGDNTTASSAASHAEGDKTVASGASSHAEGSGTVASGSDSHAEGAGATASGYWSHAEGYNTIAGKDASHAEGNQTTASGPYSHAEGSTVTASGISSHAEGSSTTASGAWSHAEGQFTIANNDAEHASGKFNVSNEDTLFSVGDGTDSDNRHNAFEITKTGGKLHDRDIAVKDDIINPNLLINPDFRINQRGISGTFSDTGKYFVDRWRLVSGTVTVNSDGTLTLNGDICQPLENAVGTNVTASVSAGTAVYDNTTQTFTITGNGDVISWAKLEYGNAATAFIPPEPTTEMMKCKRYYRTMSRGTLAFAVNAVSVVFVDPFEIPMRIDPTAKILSPVVLNYCNGWLDQPDVTKMSIVSTNLTKMGACYIHVSGFNVTVGGTEFAANYPFRAATDNFIGFDAEIY